MSRTVQAIVVIIAAVLLLSGVTVAAIPSADGTIDACRETRTGAIILIDKEAGKTCPSGWAALSWNQRGPQGPAGPAGTIGPAGPAGPAQTLETIYRVGPLNSTSAVDCPAGYRVTGGGFQVQKTTQAIVVPVTEDIISKPRGEVDNPIGWEASASSTEATTYEVRAYVVCARLVPAS